MKIKCVFGTALFFTTVLHGDPLSINVDTKSDGGLQLFLEVSEEGEKKLWLESEEGKDLVWQKQKEKGYSIATNRGVEFRKESRDFVNGNYFGDDFRNNTFLTDKQKASLKQQLREAVETNTELHFPKESENGFYDFPKKSTVELIASKYITKAKVSRINQRLLDIKEKFPDFEDPDPYDNVQLVKASLADDVLVVIYKFGKPELNLHSENPSYAGGYFFDQLFELRNTTYVPLFPPHSDYSWRKGTKCFHEGTPNDYNSFESPWCESHGGGEYFLRSYLRESNGKWKVHISAAVSVLWANSLSLPLKSIEIEDENTYLARFEGEYEYFNIYAEEKLKEYYTKLGLRYPTGLFDYYGEVEKIIYKGEVKPGETVEKIKLIPSPESAASTVFTEIFTTFNGSEEYYRLAYEKDLYRMVNSWYGFDELDDNQVMNGRYSLQTTDNPRAYSLGESKRVPVSFGVLQPGYMNLNENEIRQVYCLNIEEARKELESRIQKLNEEQENYQKLTGETAFDNTTRDRIYLDLINEQLNGKDTLEN